MATFKEKTDEFAANIRKNITSILLDVGIVGISVIYVFYNILDFHKTETDPWRLLMKGLVGIFVGVGLKWMLGEKGLIKGHNDKTFTRPKEAFDERADNSVPYIDRFDDFAEKERIEKVLRNRKIHLNNYRMKYETFFDENGDYIEHEIWTPRKAKKYFKNPYDDTKELPENVIVLDWKQRWCLRKCVKLQIFVPNVFSEYGDTVAQDEKPEKTEQEIRRKNTRSNFISAVIFAMIGVYFVPDILNFSWAAIIWSIFQVFMWLVFGIMNFYQNFTFVIIDEVKTIAKKDKLLTKFLIFALGGRENYNKEFNPKPKEEPKEEETKEIEISVEKAKELGIINETKTTRSQI